MPLCPQGIGARKEAKKRRKISLENLLTTEKPDGILIKLSDKSRQEP